MKYRLIMEHFSRLSSAAVVNGGLGQLQPQNAGSSCTATVCISSVRKNVSTLHCWAKTSCFKLPKVIRSFIILSFMLLFLFISFFFLPRLFTLPKK